MTDRRAKAFTLVFAGDIRQFNLNPLTTKTPWGIPYAVSLGDALEENDELRAAALTSPVDGVAND